MVQARCSLFIRRSFFIVAVAMWIFPLWPVAHAEQAHHEKDSMPVTHEASGSRTADEEDKPLTLTTGSTTVQFGGFVKLDYMQDFDPIGNADQFKVNSIPVPDPGTGGSNNFSIRQTRFTVDVRNGEGTTNAVRAYVEGDFFGSGNNFRIRHAYGEWNGLLAGQTWSTFQDISARPGLLDYEGPDAEVFVRQGQLRFTGGNSAGFQWSVAAEESDSQIAVAGGVSGGGRSELPDFAGNIRFTNSVGHVQIGGVVRQLRFVSDDGSVDETESAFGLNLSGKANVLGNDAIMGQFAFGSGIGRYIESFGGTSSDAVLQVSGDLHALDAWAAVIGFVHHWNERLNSTFSANIAEVDNIAGQPGSAISAARSIHANLVYSPAPKLTVGGELMWGKRENNDGSSGDAVRLQVSIQYNFR